MFVDSQERRDPDQGDDGSNHGRPEPRDEQKSDVASDAKMSVMCVEQGGRLARLGTRHRSERSETLILTTALGYNPASDQAALPTPMSQDPAAIRILAVDDYPLPREGIAGLIADESDMTLVVQAADGREAIEQFRSHCPDVPLMDGVGLRAGRTIRRHLALVGALFLATASLVLAQTATGVIRGTVQDPTGAVVVDVQ